VETNVEAKSVVVQAEDSVTPEFMLEKLQKVRCGICGVFIIIIIINVRCLVCGHASEEAAPRNIIFWRHDFLFFFCPESMIHRSDIKIWECHYFIFIFSGVLPVGKASNWREPMAQKYVGERGKINNSHKL